jgi:hypothetical protein
VISRAPWRYGGFTRPVVAIGLALALPVMAADPLTRLTGSAQAVNTTLGFENVLQLHPQRRVGGEEVNLQPLFSWINRGKLSRGAKPFDQPCPLPDWHPIDGTIVNVMDDAVLIAKGISKSPVIVRNYPKTMKPVVGAPATIVAKAAGVFEYESGAGAKEQVPVFDYGVPFQPPAAGEAGNTIKPGPLPVTEPPGKERKKTR